MMMMRKQRNMERRRKKEEKKKRRMMSMKERKMDLEIGERDEKTMMKMNENRDIRL